MPHLHSLLLAAAQAVAPAATPLPPVPTLWLCALSQDLVRIECVADAPLPEADPPATTAVVNGTRFPLDTARRWSVPLWSPPTEIDRVELLARATICYRSPGCEVRLELPQAIARR